MPTLLLRGPLVRPQLEEAVRGLSRTYKQSNPFLHQPRQRSSSTSSPRNPPHIQTQAQPRPITLAGQIGTGATEQAAKPSDPIPGPNIVAPLPFWQRLGPLTSAGQAYARAQRSRPWATQITSALVIYLCADFGAQWMSTGESHEAEENREEETDDVKEGKRRSHDWARTTRSLAIGGTAAIPGYIWYTFLSTSFNYTSRALSIGVKVALNQLAFTPVFNIYFFGAQALLSGDTFAEAWRRVCNTVPVSFVNSCKLWPAVTAFSFAFIPFEYRSVFGGVIAVGWQTYLSFLNGRAEKLEALRQKMEKDRQAVPLEKREKSPAAAVDMV